MPCLNPIRGFRGRNGRLVMRPSQAVSFEPLAVSCGRCIECRLEYSRQWAIRIMHEASMHEANSFITLTYDDDHLPVDRSLDKGAWQRFCKRARKSGLAFRYFHCGEYGRLGRPHYHACLFGVDFAFDRRVHRRRAGGTYWVSDTLRRLWPFGYHVIANLTFESAAYVARYVVKKIHASTPEAKRDLWYVDRETGVVRQPEYATMSRGGRGSKGGIGRGWVEKYGDDVYPADELNMRGTKVRPPRYYDAVRAEVAEAEMELVKERRQQVAEAEAKKWTPARRRARMAIQESRLALRKSTVE